jgi:hypothetical protein
MPPNSQVYRRGDRKRDEIGPARDRCSGVGGYVPCTYWPGEALGKCFVGAMGWLQACRAAYVEGVDVLYGTCNFHVRGAWLFQRLPRVLVAERLQSVTAVEMIWELELFDTPMKGTRRWQTAEENAAIGRQLPGGKVDTLDQYLVLVGAIPMVLPNLQYLFISLQGAPSLVSGDIEVWETERIAEEVERLLEPIDQLVRKMEFRGCRIALPSSLFIAMGGTTRVKLDKAIVELAQVREDEYESFDGVLICEAAERRLLAVGDSDSRKYWLCHGQLDLQFSLLYGQVQVI